MALLKSVWLRTLTQGEGKRVIVIVPPAGAGATMFRPWARSADDDTDVVVVTAPGREHRLTEEPFRHVAPVADAVAAELAELGRAMVLFGHSAGAYVAHEVAARLPGRIRHVVVAGAASPDFGSSNYALATDAELLAAMRAWEGTPPEILGDPSIVEIFLPCLRADLAVAHSCRRLPTDSNRLDVPLTALVGSHDRFATAEQAATWAQWTTAAFSLRTVDGGHFFPITAAAEVVPFVSGLFANVPDLYGETLRTGGSELVVTQRDAREPSLGND